MLKIDMFSTADKVKGQGVGSAYVELIAMLKNIFPMSLTLKSTNLIVPILVITTPLIHLFIYRPFQKSEEERLDMFIFCRKRSREA